MRYHKSKFVLRRVKALLALSLFLTPLAGNLSVVQAAGPTVSITSPINNTIQQGTIDLTAAASPDTLGVTFKIAGPGMTTKTFAEDTTAPYSVTWDSTVAPTNKMDYTATAIARGTGGTTTSAPIKIKLDNAPIPGKVIVVGDSVTQQAFDPDGDGTNSYTTNAPADRNIFAKMGWTTKDVQTTVNNYSIFRHPQKLVVAVGLNDASTFFSDGWTADDLTRFRTLLNTPNANTCIALVLPGHAETGSTSWFNSWAAQIDEARADLITLAAERPRTVIIDWQTVIDEHPEYVDEDGIHLLTPHTSPMEDLMDASAGQMNTVDPAAAEARQNFYWDGVAQCDAPTASFETPTNSSAIEGTTPLSVNATNANSVQFQVDGQNIGAPITSAPFQVDWDSTTMPDGSPISNGNHTITAVSSNQIGTHTASITVNVLNPPILGSVGLIGDSVTYNSLNSTGDFYTQTFFGNKPQNLTAHYFPGWTHADSLTHVKQWAANRRPEILINAYGFNDVKVRYPIPPYWPGDGFTEADRTNILATLNSPHPSSCKVLVLPGWGSGLGYIPPSDSPSNDAALLAWEHEYIQELQELRAFYIELGAQRNDIVVVDWQPVIDAHPEYIDPDGLHLAKKAEGTGEGWRTDAAEARQAMYWDGVAQCQTLLANR
jgi:hypothetical protein